jgi:hypothetical protein
VRSLFSLNISQITMIFLKETKAKVTYMSILPEYPVVQDWFKTQLYWGGRMAQSAFYIGAENRKCNLANI